MEDMVMWGEMVLTKHNPMTVCTTGEFSTYLDVHWQVIGGEGKLGMRNKGNTKKIGNVQGGEFNRNTTNCGSKGM
ncbi:hypothetical protein U1Q18_036252 [Sarracenia purpurea var. burkii]